MRLMNIPRSKAQPNELQLNLSVSPKPVPQKPTSMLAKLSAMKARPNRVDALRQRAAEDNELIKLGAQNHKCDEEIELIVVGNEIVQETIPTVESQPEPSSEPTKDENVHSVLVFNTAPVDQVPEKKTRKNKKQKD